MKFLKSFIFLGFLFFSCEKESRLSAKKDISSISVKELSGVTFSVSGDKITTASKVSHRFLNALQNDITIEFKLSEKARLFVRDKETFSGDKVRLTQNTSNAKKYELSLEIEAEDGSKKTYVLSVILSASSEKELHVLSIKEIPDFSFNIDKTKKEIKGILGYNPSYMNPLKNGCTFIFQVSDAAKLAINEIQIGAATKITMTKTQIDRSINIMGNPMILKDNRFSATVEVIAEDLSKETYTLQLDIKGQPIDATKLSQSIYPTAKYIGVHRSPRATKAQLNRVYNGVNKITDRLDPFIQKALLKNKVTLLVLENEREVMAEASYFLKLQPLEAIYGNNGGKDETLPDPTTGISTGELEFCYMTIYYAISIEPELSTAFNELKTAYDEAFNKSPRLFSPGAAYQDGYSDPIHPVASQNNVLKYGSFVFNLYKVYHTKNTIPSSNASEYQVFSRSEMQAKNPLAHAFMKKYFDN